MAIAERETFALGTWDIVAVATYFTLILGVGLSVSRQNTEGYVKFAAQNVDSISVDVQEEQGHGQRLLPRRQTHVLASCK